MAKKFLILMVAIIMALGLFAGCPTNNSDSEKIEVGFIGQRKKGDLFCGAKSDILIFNTDNVKIDFYLGLDKNWTLEDRDLLGYKYVGVAAYFYGHENSHWKLGENGDGKIADYHNIEKVYFIKEFSAEEFFTEKYAATYTARGFLGGKSITEFNYYETFTVPKEVLGKDSYNFYFDISAVWFSEENNHFVFGNWFDGINFSYIYLDDSQIKITSATKIKN